MRPSPLLLSLLAFLSPTSLWAADMALTANFNVMAPDEAMAKSVARQAEAFRKEAALEWFGKELPRGQGPAMISIEISAKEDEGLTWPIDTPERKFHQVWLTTSAKRATGTTLHHEIVHTVLDSFTYPGFLPAWASEGIASQVDDSERKESRREIAARWARDGRWPQLSELLQARQIAHTDRESYAAAASLTQYLASRGSKPKVVEFARAGQRNGWDQAAHDVYAVQNVAELQAQWQQWVGGNSLRDNSQASANAIPSSTGVN
jgi:hypothetical protein